jgi:hypothetical protein
MIPKTASDVKAVASARSMPIRKPVAGHGQKLVHCPVARHGEDGRPGVDIAAREPLLEAELPDVGASCPDAWFLLHDDLRRLALFPLVADQLSSALATVLRFATLPAHSGASVRAT